MATLLVVDFPGVAAVVLSDEGITVALNLSVKRRKMSSGVRWKESEWRRGTSSRENTVLELMLCCLVRGKKCLPLRGDQGRRCSLANTTPVAPRTTCRRSLGVGKARRCWKLVGRECCELNARQETGVAWNFLIDVGNTEAAQGRSGEVENV